MPMLHAQPALFGPIGLRMIFAAGLDDSRTLALSDFGRRKWSIFDATCIICEPILNAGVQNLQENIESQCSIFARTCII
jgi:hypothetical protein